jgi:predicted AAA+ superfamily ATPase
MYISRKIEAEIKKYLNTKEILALIGPRQSGKTTVLKKIFENLQENSKIKASFISFEDRDVLSLFNESVKDFAETYLKGNDFLFIDEFQYAKEGGKSLKYLFDTFDTKIIISGSSAIDLTINTLKFLVGRIFILEMKPFDFEEFLLAKDENYYKLYLGSKIDFLKNKNKKVALVDTQKKVFRNYFEEYAIWGGYPRVVLSENLAEKEVVLKNIYSTYFLREVKTLIDIADDYQLERVIKLLGLQIGNLVEYDNLSNETNISFATLKKYVNFLEKTYICKLVKPFYKNKRKEIVKIPKAFFFDTGLRNVIANDFRALDDRVDAGELLENAVWMQLDRKGFDVQYWRDKNKNEVDLILELKQKMVVAIEIKKNRKRCKELPEAFVKEYNEAKTYCGYLNDVSSHLQNNIKKSSNIFIPLI